MDHKVHPLAFLFLMVTIIAIFTSVGMVVRGVVGVQPNIENISGRVVLGQDPKLQPTNSNSGYKDNLIQLRAVEDRSGIYRWMGTNKSEINPTLTLTANANNTIEILNPTDEVHRLMLTLGDKNLTSSGDIHPEETGRASIRPYILEPNATRIPIMEYHCEHHPQTMKGNIQIMART